MSELRLPGPARPGDVLGGRYQLDQLIGEGGMGSVWRATDRVLARTVAVKVFWSGVTHETDGVRRESEKRLLASVSHPSLVTLFDAHLSNENVSYLVMEHVEGGTLSTLIAKGPIGPKAAAALASDLAEALHVVHGAGIIHRDVKPANILLRPPLTPQHSFRAVLADFGIAHVADASRVTAPGTAMGTAAYIAPEQVRGLAPSPASDIYSLGLVLIEALCGRRAFPAQTPIEAISVRLSTAPEVPGHWGYGWRSLLSAMTALDPDERPPALEVARRARALDQSDAEPEPTRPVAVLPSAIRAAHTHPLAPQPSVAIPIAERGAPARYTRREMQKLRARGIRRRRSFIGGGALAAAAAVALTVWSGAAAFTPSPTETPRMEQPAPASPALPSAPSPASPGITVLAEMPDSASGGDHDATQNAAADPVSAEKVLGTDAPAISDPGKANAGPGESRRGENAGKGGNNGNGGGARGNG